jgi:hypothetical protein
MYKEVIHIKKSISFLFFFLLLSSSFVLVVDNIPAITNTDITLLLQSPSFTQTLQKVVSDGTYVFSGGSNINYVYRYYISDMTKKDQSASTGGSILNIVQDSTYIYASSFSNKIYKFNKATLATVCSSASITPHQGLCADDATYVYAGGGTTRVYGFDKTDLSTDLTSADLSQAVYSVCVDSTYVYAGSNGKIWKFYRNNLTTVTSASYGAIYALEENGDYLYAGRSTDTIYEVYKSNLSTHKSVSYGGAVWDIDFNADKTSIFAVGATTTKIVEYLISDFSILSESSSYGGIIYGVDCYTNFVFCCGATTQKVNKYYVTDSISIDITNYDGDVNVDTSVNVIFDVSNYYNLTGTMNYFINKLPLYNKILNDTDITKNNSYSVDISSLDDCTLYQLIVNYNISLGTIISTTYFATSCPCGSTNSTNLTKHFNLINVTGSLDSIYNSLTGWDIWANYTGNVTGGCSGIVWVNYSDMNISFNVSVDKATDANTSNYSINLTNWLYIGVGSMVDVVISMDMTLLFTLLLMIGWIVFTVLFFKNRFTKNSIILGFLQFCFAMPLTFIVGSLSTGFVLGYAVVFIIPVLSILMLAIAFFDRKR